MVDGPSLTIRTRPGGHFKLEVIPRFALETARALTQFQPMLDALKLEFCGSPGTDAALVRYVNREAAKRGWTLQRLLSQHCEAELRDVFDAGASYRLQLGEGAALRAVHKKVLAAAGK